MWGKQCRGTEDGYDNDRMAAFSEISQFGSHDTLTQNGENLTCLESQRSELSSCLWKRWQPKCQTAVNSLSTPKTSRQLLQPCSFVFLYINISSVLSYFVILEELFHGQFFRQNHLWHNGLLILQFILTRHWGHHSEPGPSFQTNMHEGEPEFWQGILDAVSRPELSCLLAARHVCSCKSHQIRSHRIGEHPVESHSSTAGLTPLCVIQIWGEYGKTSSRCAAISAAVFLSNHIISSSTDTLTEAWSEHPKKHKRGGARWHMANYWSWQANG